MPSQSLALGLTLIVAPRLAARSYVRPLPATLSDKTQKTAGLLKPGGLRLPKNTLVIRAFELALAAEAFLSLRSQPALETATEQVQYD